MSKKYICFDNDDRMAGPIEATLDKAYKSYCDHYSLEYVHTDSMIFLEVTEIPVQIKTVIEQIKPNTKGKKK